MREKEWKFRVMKLSRPPIHISASNWIKIKILCDTTNLIIFFNELFFSTGIVFQPTKFLRDREFRYIFNTNSFLQPNRKKPSEKKKEIFDSSFTSFFFLLLFLSLWIYSFELKNIEWKIEVLRNTRIEIFLAFVSEIFRTKLQKIKRRKK